jgi:DNA-binding transcriptional LysR family regulator
MKHAAAGFAPPRGTGCARAADTRVSRRPLLYTHVPEPAEWFQNAGVELRPVMELGNSEAIKTLVAAGVGVAILPVERKQGLLPYGRVQVRPLKPPLIRHLGLVRRRDKALEPPLQIVHEALLTLSNPMS